MNRKQLVQSLRKEAWEIDALVKKFQARAAAIRALADEIEAADPSASSRDQAPPTKFRKIVDAIYGEKPKKSRRD